MEGELVCTSLDSESVPLVRFRSHDYVEVSDTECACGRTGFGISHSMSKSDCLQTSPRINPWRAVYSSVFDIEA